MKYLTLLVLLAGCENEFIDLGPEDVQDAEISGEVESDAELDAPVDDAVETEEMEVEPDADTVDTEPLDVEEVADESADVPDEADAEVDAEAEADAEADVEADAEADGYDASSEWWGVPGGPCNCDSDCLPLHPPYASACWYHICVWLTPTPCEYGRPWVACGTAEAVYCITKSGPLGNICIPGCEGPWVPPTSSPCLTGICDDRTYPDGCVPSNDSIAAGDCDASCSSYCLPVW